MSARRDLRPTHAPRAGARRGGQLPRALAAALAVATGPACALDFAPTRLGFDVVTTEHELIGARSITSGGVLLGATRFDTTNPYRSAAATPRLDRAGLELDALASDPPFTTPLSRRARALAPFGDGFALAGYDGERAWVRALDATGAPRWSADVSIDGAGGAVPQTVAVATRGDRLVVLANLTGGSGARLWWTLVADRGDHGEALATHDTLGLEGATSATARDAVALTDDARPFALVGTSLDANFLPAGVVLFLDAAGALASTHPLPLDPMLGSAPYTSTYVTPYAAVADDAGGLVVAGEVDSGHVFVATVDATGALSRARSFCFDGASTARISRLVRTPDGFAAVGLLSAAAGGYNEQWVGWLDADGAPRAGQQLRLGAALAQGPAPSIALSAEGGILAVATECTAGSPDASTCSSASPSTSLGRVLHLDPAGLPAGTVGALSSTTCPR